MSDNSNINLIKTSQINSDASREFVLTIADAADDRKGGDITLLRVADVSYLADYFVIVTYYSRTSAGNFPVNSRSGEREWLRKPLRTEGQAEGSWIVLDYGDVIVHILMPKEREFYNLEAFWGHAQRIELPASSRLGE